MQVDTHQLTAVKQQSPTYLIPFVRPSIGGKPMLRLITPTIPSASYQYLHPAVRVVR